MAIAMRNALKQGNDVAVGGHAR